MLDEFEVGPAKSHRRDFRTQAYILTGLLVPWMVLTYCAVSSGSPSDVRDRPVLLTTIAAITGPFVGAVARNGQTCCLRASLHLAAICGPALALGIITQFVPMPFQRGREAARLLLWTCGWLAWFCGGFVSFLHAFF